jgi:hypothetical protein
MMIDDHEFEAVDREALNRALMLAQAESQGRREKIARMLREDGWFEAAHFACYSRQIDRLASSRGRIRPVMATSATTPAPRICSSRCWLTA